MSPATTGQSLHLEEARHGVGGSAEQQADLETVMNALKRGCLSCGQFSAMNPKQFAAGENVLLRWDAYSP